MSTRTRGNWDQVVGKLKERWGDLNEDELTEFDGNAQQLVGYIELRTADTRDEIQKYVDGLMGEGSSIQRAQQAAKEYAQLAGETLAEYAQRTGQSLSHAYQTASSAAYQGYEQAAEGLRQRPVGSVAVAFGTGLIAGMLVALSLRNR